MNEELLIISQLSSGDSRIAKRKRELAIDHAAEDIDVSMDEARAEVETASILRLSNPHHVLPTAGTAFSMEHSILYQKAREKNEFPFDATKVDEVQLYPYLHPLHEECKKTISWKHACDNGLAQTVFCMSLSTNSAVREYALQLYTALIDKSVDTSLASKKNRRGAFWSFQRISKKHVYYYSKAC